MSDEDSLSRQHFTTELLQKDAYACPFRRNLASRQQLCTSQGTHHQILKPLCPKVGVLLDPMDVFWRLRLTHQATYASFVPMKEG